MRVRILVILLLLLKFLWFIHQYPKTTSNEWSEIAIGGEKDTTIILIEKLLNPPTLIYHSNSGYYELQFFTQTTGSNKMLFLSPVKILWVKEHKKSENIW